MRDMQEYTAAYLQSGFESYQVRYRRKKVLEQLQRYPHGSILEIGCGEAPLYDAIDGWNQYYIVEPSDVFFENAVSEIHGRNIICIKGFFEDAVEQLRGIRFDFIVCSCLLHELEDPHALLAAIASVCHPDTVIHFNVPNAKSLHRLLAFEMGLIDDVFQRSETQARLQQHSTFDMQTLENLLVQHGFITLDAGTFFPKLLTHDQLYRCMQDGIFGENLLDGMYKMETYLPDYGSELYINATHVATKSRENPPAAKAGVVPRG